MKHLQEKFEKSNQFSVLNDDQKKFFDYFFNRRNVFLTGSAGVGKSFVINSLLDFTAKENLLISRVASTGIAALQIGGQTLHSWAGMGLADEDIKNLIKTVARNKKAVSRIMYARVLFLDEVSMIKSDLLDKFDMIMKYFRNNNEPFGGIQLITCGDFCQLPPVFRGSENESFAFESRSWREANFKMVHLQKIMRQDSNSAFAVMLNKMRFGDSSDIHILNSRIDAKFPDDGIKPIKIFCKNIDVDKANQIELDKLTTEEKTYNSVDFGEEHHIKFFDKNCLAPKSLRLKIGAQVMLLCNLDSDNGLVNGSVGIVESFTTDGPMVKFNNGKRAITLQNTWSIKEQYVDHNKEIQYKVVAERKQVPLKLGYAQSAHKAQGQTLTRAEIDMSDAFATGQAYVALSRVRDLDSLSVKPFCPSRIFANQKCVDFYQKNS